MKKTFKVKLTAKFSGMDIFIFEAEDMNKGIDIIMNMLDYPTKENNIDLLTNSVYEVDLEKRTFKYLRKIKDEDLKDLDA